MRGFVRFLQDLALLLARIGFGLLLVLHAWHRWENVGMPQEVDLLRQAGVPQPGLLAWGALGLEAVGGVMLVLGLAVPLVALAVLVMNVLVIAWLKWGHGVYFHNDGFEHNLVQALLALVLTTFGSGRAGLDALFGRRRREDPEQRMVRDVP
ncbi:DoxX family protein [Luteococcus peritonei]|uniref:DoxX family protein n=1 Tax=Luteococcus peritonei TaxID=88874 RepID=A0ABW4RUC3_9ACTN